MSPPLARFAALVALAASPALAHDHHAHASPAGVAGSPREATRTVEIVMTDAGDRMVFAPSALQVRRGVTVRLLVRNEGSADHEIVIGTRQENDAHAAMMAEMPDMRHDDANALRLGPGGKGELVWKFTSAGTIDFSCLIPGHREAGMTGTVSVK